MPCGRISIASRSRACACSRLRDRGLGFAARERERAVVTVDCASPAARFAAGAGDFLIFASAPLEVATCEIPVFPQALCGNKIKMR